MVLNIYLYSDIFVCKSDKIIYDCKGFYCTVLVLKKFRIFAKQLWPCRDHVPTMQPFFFLSNHDIVQVVGKGVITPPLRQCSKCGRI